MRDHRNDDLLHTGHPRKKHESIPQIQPNDEAPRWANILSYQLALLTQEIRQMRQTTQDIVNAVNDLVANSAKIDQAIDDLAAAKSNDDDAALATAVGQLVNLKNDQNAHLAKVVAAVPPVVGASSDTANVNIDKPVGQ